MTKRKSERWPSLMEGDGGGERGGRGLRTGGEAH